MTPPPHHTICDLLPVIQGEATWAGRPMLLVRFSGCPLACPWCDEPRHRDPTVAQRYTTAELLSALDGLGTGVPFVLLTGGEPLAAPHLGTLVAALKGAGFWIAMETSGVGGPVPDGVDWLTVSPKTPLPDPLLARANEIKWVLGPDPDPRQDGLIRHWAARHDHVWVQPRSEASRPIPAAVGRCVALVHDLRGRVRLSTQTHKCLGLP